MSGYLARQVWRSGLSPKLKPLAACMAGLAPLDDGARIFPSVAHLAWLVGVGPRAIQYQLAELRALHIIAPQGGGRGGRQGATRYQFNAGNLPQRPSWRGARGAMGCTLSSAGGVQPVAGEGCNQIRERVQPVAPRSNSYGSKDYVGRVGEPQRKRNLIARPVTSQNCDTRQPPNRLLEAIDRIDQLMNHDGLTFDDAMVRVRMLREFADRWPGEDFMGTVVFYFRKARGVELGGKVRA